MSNRQQRVLYLDWLRIFACLMIIGIHVSALYVNLAADRGTVTLIYNVYQNIIRCGNQLFFMISGALFLNRKEVNIRRLFGHNATRIIVVYFLWSALYAVDTMRQSGAAYGMEEFLTLLLQGKYHMWLLPRMVAMYVLLPILFAIAHYEQGKYLKYYVKAFLITLVINMFFESAAFVPDALRNLGQSLLPEFCQDAGYMLLGYYIATLSEEKLRKRYLVIGYLVSLVVSVLFSGRGLVFEAIFLFAFMRRWNPKGKGAGKIVSYISSCTLGIILLHIFVLEHFEAWFQVSVLTWNPVVAVPGLTCMVFVITLIPIAIMRCIPIVKDWCM